MLVFPLLPSMVNGELSSNEVVNSELDNKVDNNKSQEEIKARLLKKNQINFDKPDYKWTFGFGMLLHTFSNNDSFRTLSKIDNNREGFEYDQLGNIYGYELYLNYEFYRSKLWRLKTGFIYQNFLSLEGNSLNQDTASLYFYGKGKCGQKTDHCRSLNLQLNMISLEADYNLGYSSYVGFGLRTGLISYELVYGYEYYSDPESEQFERREYSFEKKDMETLAYITFGFYDPIFFFSTFFWRATYIPQNEKTFTDPFTNEILIANYGGIQYSLLTGISF